MTSVSRVFVLEKFHPRPSRTLLWLITGSLEQFSQVASTRLGAFSRKGHLIKC